MSDEQEEYLGAIKLFATAFVPRKYMLCDGRTLSVRDHPALFSLLGAQFGGDARSTFCLPDLKGMEPVPHTQYCICVDGLYPMRPD